MQTRNSAAYKGVMALILQDSPLDFMTGHRMDIASYIDEDADIHHIFPQTYCEKNNLPRIKWNSVINKTPIYASSNRSIGGHAPSTYIGTMANKGLKHAGSGSIGSGRHTVILRIHQVDMRKAAQTEIVNPVFGQRFAFGEFLQRSFDKR